MTDLTMIVPFEEVHWPAVWRVIEPVFREGETYPCPMDISEDAAREYWISKPDATQVALDQQGNVLGTYFIVANQPGLGSHVCNCGYIVSAAARGQGWASRFCQHSQVLAREMGFSAMQYNLVVTTNEAAVHVWQKNGFEIIGTLPRAFRSKSHGLVDAFVMYKWL